MVKTTKITGGAMYAKVSDRLLAFRQENPRASIETKPEMQENGMVLFKAKIIKDKADEYSAESTGHALQTKVGIKDFEKLETVAVGRALALLGYAVDGEIASSEEMEEFLEYQKTKKEQAIDDIKQQVDDIKTLEELREFYKTHKGLGKEIDTYITEKSKELKNDKS